MILRELARQLGCGLRGDGDVEVNRIAGIDQARPGDLTFVSSPKYVTQLAITGASAVIARPEYDSPLPTILTDNPYLTIARAIAILHPPSRPRPGVHPSAVVDPSAQLGLEVHLGPFVVIGPRAKVGDRSILHAHVVLYEEAAVGADCLVHSAVQLRERCRLGDRVIVQSGAVIGSDGFGFAREADGTHHKIPQVGIVVVEDDVEIGALTAIDRASMGETRIERGTKIDNLVQIGHSVRVGHDSILCAQVGVAGSSRLGAHVTLAGQVGVADHVTVGDRVIASAKTGIPSAIREGAIISGYPAVDNRTWLKSSAIIARLPELLRRLRELERRLAPPPTGTPSDQAPPTD